jgi:hypothetical protein
MLLSKSIEATQSSNLKEPTQAFTAEYRLGQESSIINSVNQLNSYTPSREVSVDMLNGFHNISINRGFTTIDHQINQGSNDNIMLSGNIDDLPDIVNKRPIKNISGHPANMKRLKIEFENIELKTTIEKDHLNTQSVD